MGPRLRGDAAAHNLARPAPGKMSMRARRKAAAWDDGYLLSLAAA